ncbi:MAG: hypothetical protein RLZZ427_736 [Pseudomonadota bacterium]
MSGQTIKRGGKTVRKAAAQDRARPIRGARDGGILDTILNWLPISEAQLHRIFLALIFGSVLALGWVVASFAGVPAMIDQQVAMASHAAGLEVRNISVRGTKNLSSARVYDLALADNHRAMPLLDLDALRARLLQLPWVEDARVSRQLPDTLMIDIVERAPVAVLRKLDQLVLIDAAGHELEAVAPDRAAGKLAISGFGADLQVLPLAALLDTAPALKPQVAEAEWVGNRRWNLTFRTGQVLALPEGEAQAKKALTTFARLDGVNRLLGGKVAAFDMRAPDRIYLRVPGRTDPAAQAGLAPATTDVAALGVAAAGAVAAGTAPQLAPATPAPVPVPVATMPAPKIPAPKIAAPKIAAAVKAPVAKPVSAKATPTKAAPAKVAPVKPASTKAAPIKAGTAKAAAAKVAPAAKSAPAKVGVSKPAKPSTKPGTKSTAKSTSKPASTKPTVTKPAKPASKPTSHPAKAEKH